MTGEALNLGDRVRVDQSALARVNGREGTISKIDHKNSYPYCVEFDDGEDPGSCPFKYDELTRVLPAQVVQVIDRESTAPNADRIERQEKDILKLLTRTKVLEQELARVQGRVAEQKAELRRRQDSDRQLRNVIGGPVLDRIEASENVLLYLLNQDAKRS